MKRCSMGFSTPLVACVVHCLLLSACSILFDEFDSKVADSECSTLAPLHDTFSGEELDEKWAFVVSSSGATTVRTGQSGLEFVFNDQDRAKFGYVSSLFEHDLRESALTVEVEPLPLGANAYIELIARIDGGGESKVSLSVDEDKAFEITVAGAVTLPTDTLKEGDRFWRIRLTDGRLYFEVGSSTSSSDMRVLHSTSALGNFNPSAVKAKVGMNTPNSSQAGEVIFASVNAEKVNARYCPVSTLIEPFLGTELDSPWTLPASNGNGCSFTVANGALEIQRVIASTGNCTIATLRAFSLENSAIELQLTEALASPVASLSLDFRINATEEIRLFVDGGGVWASMRNGTDSRNISKADVKGITLIRIRHENGLVVLEYENGESVKELDALLSIIDIKNLKVSVTLRSGPQGLASISGINAD